jgi:tRNA-dihydrouridine synthase
MLPKFSNKAFLAPMAGVSDPALRLQCKQFGAGLVVTEFTNIHSIIAKEKQLKENKKTIQEFLEYSLIITWDVLHHTSPNKWQEVLFYKKVISQSKSLLLW